MSKFGRCLDASFLRELKSLEGQRLTRTDKEKLIKCLPVKGIKIMAKSIIKEPNSKENRRKGTDEIVMGEKIYKGGRVQLASSEEKSE